MPSLLVSIPTFDGSVKAKTSEALGNAIEYADAHLWLEYSHRYFGGYAVDRARNFMAQEALDRKVNYLLMVDSDVVPPERGLFDLISMDADIALGWYVRGSSDCGETNTVKLGMGYSDCYYAHEIREIEEPFEVKASGMGFALINTDVFRRMGRPWFKYVDNPDGSGLSEDYWFCQQCRNAGLRVWVHPKVGCGHIKDRVLEAK